MYRRYYKPSLLGKDCSKGEQADQLVSTSLLLFRLDCLPVTDFFIIFFILFFVVIILIFVFIFSA